MPFAISAGVIFATLTLASCSWQFPEYTQHQLDVAKEAKRVEVSRDDLPAGSYQVLGKVTWSAPVMERPCNEKDIAYEAVEKYGSKVDAVINFGGGNSLGNNLLAGCYGTAVHLVHPKTAS